MFELRPYQNECLDAISKGHEDHDSVGVQLATGLGKTILVSRYASRWEDGRTMVVVPFQSLVHQTCNKIMRETHIWPAIEQGMLRSNESCEALRNPYVVAMKQSLCSGRNTKRYERFRDVGLLVVDEVHHAATKAFKTMIDWFRDRGAKVLGLSATIKRHDKKAMSQVLDDVVYEYGIREAIDDGWLSPIRVTAMRLSHMDLSSVDSKVGFGGERDYVTRQLNEILEDHKVVYEVAEATARATTGKKTAIYCSSVDQARAVALCLQEHYGINASWIAGDKRLCTDERRKAVMGSFMTFAPGEITHVASVGTLTTGWDFPALECIVMARPTRSQPLYTQILGRVSRPTEDDGVPVIAGCDTAEARKSAMATSHKPHALVIDLVDASCDHKLVTSGDILGGKMSLVERQALKEALLEREQADIDEVLAEQKRKIADEEMRRALAKKKVQEAQYQSQDVDPFSGPSGPSFRMSAGKAQATPKQRAFIRRLGFWSVGDYSFSKNQASRIIDQLKSGTTVSEVVRTNRLKRRSYASSQKTTEQQPKKFEEVDFNEVFGAFRS